MAQAADKPNILILEDEDGVRAVLEAALAGIGHITSTSTTAQAEEELERKNFSLLLTDVNLPDGNGFELCRKIRSNRKLRQLPILFLTAQTDMEDIVRGFSLGASDYIAKPFETSELIARVTVQLRRSSLDEVPTAFTKFNFSVDLLQQKAILYEAGAEHHLDLTPIEFKLLVIFLKNENIILARQELLDIIWGPGVHVSNNTLDTHISSLRKKMLGCGPYLKAAVKQGFCYKHNQL